MGRITLTPSREKFDLQLLLLDALKNTGWQGTWSVEDDTIHVDYGIGVSLEEYIHVKPLDYADGLRLALCLGAQLAELSGNEERLGEKYGVLFFNINDILVIDKDWYLLTNLSKVLPLSEENQLVLQHPIPLDGFLAPELVGANTLPLVAEPSCAYYSLALLCLQALGLNDDDIDRLMGSKMYYLLRRCLERNPMNRVFLYVCDLFYSVYFMAFIL